MRPLVLNDLLIARVTLDQHLGANRRRPNGDDAPAFMDYGIHARLLKRLKDGEVLHDFALDDGAMTFKRKRVLPW